MAQKKYRYNPISTDFKYGPWESLAAVKTAIPLILRYDGLTVNVAGTEYNWLAADLTDNGLVAKTSGGGSGTSMPKINNVYLVNSVDAVAMGGTAGNAYSTFQSAYDAAVVLQLAAGGSTKVIINVGNITAAQSGDLTLAANWNTDVSIVGINLTVSVLGNIVGSASFNINMTATNVSIGNITAEAGITLNLNNVNAGILNTVSATGASGNINLTLDSSTTGAVTATSNFGNTGTITINGYNSDVGNINNSMGSAIADFSTGLISINTLGKFITLGSVRTKNINSNKNFEGPAICAGISINNTSTNQISVGRSTLLNTPSDNIVNNVTINNCTITSHLLINSSSGSAYGGGINIVVMTNVKITSGTARPSIVNDTITPGNSKILRIDNLQMNGEVADLFIKLVNATYNIFHILNSYIGRRFTLTNDSLNEYVTFSSPAKIINCSIGSSMQVSFGIPAADSSALEHDLIMLDCIIGNMLLGTSAIQLFGDTSVLIARTYADMCFDLVGSKTKYITIENSTINNAASQTTSTDPTSLKLNVKNSTVYVGTDTTDYNIESFCSNIYLPDTLATLSGNINSSNLTIGSSITNGATNNNSYINVI